MGEVWDISPAIKTPAKTWLRNYQMGDFSEPMFSREFREKFPRDKPGDEMTVGILAPNGEPTAFDFVGSDTNDRRTTAYSLHVTF